MTESLALHPRRLAAVAHHSAGAQCEFLRDLPAAAAHYLRGLTLTLKAFGLPPPSHGGQSPGTQWQDPRMKGFGTTTTRYHQDFSVAHKAHTLSTHPPPNSRGRWDHVLPARRCPPSSVCSAVAQGSRVADFTYILSV